MLDTGFVRPPGDVGHPDTFGFPVLRQVVAGARVARVVRSEPDLELIGPFVAAGRELIARGAIGISTSCGFLAPFQRELADALAVPVAISSLLQVPWVDALLPTGRRCGVITARASALSPGLLARAGAPSDTPVAGMPAGGRFERRVLHDEGSRPGASPAPATRSTSAGAPEDEPGFGDELVAAGRELVRRHPEVGAIVLECTNLPPWRDRLAAELACPVFDITTLLNWFWQGLAAASLPVSAAPTSKRDDS
ncbi:MAG: aspartate/glutamate racemase family protein [Burkholderiaceae bacterium]|nr:aspartate/glutamate racemase family protein [Burkholderiaceae bacterium]